MSLWYGGLLVRLLSILDGIVVRLAQIDQFRQFAFQLLVWSYIPHVSQVETIRMSKISANTSVHLLALTLARSMHPLDTYTAKLCSHFAHLSVNSFDQTDVVVGPRHREI